MLKIFTFTRAIIHEILVTFLPIFAILGFGYNFAQLYSYAFTSDSDLGKVSPTTQSKHHVHEPPVVYYFLAIISALLVGLNCFVVALNYMLSHHVNLFLASACGVAGMVLNTALFWRGGPKKLYNFCKGLPGSLYSYKTLSALCGGLCMGALTFDAYLSQYATMSAWWQSMLPCYSVATVFSVANALSNFVLFYDDDSEDLQTPKKPIHYSATLSSGLQSSVYTFLNYTCVYSLFSLLMPAYATFNNIASMVLASGLLVSECKFNYSVLSETKSDSPTLSLLSQRNYAAKAKFFLLWTAITLNGLANGWIALGSFTAIPVVLQLAVVANGTFVSIVVMKDSIDTIFHSSKDESAGMMLPIAVENRKKLTRYMLKTAAGCFVLLDYFYTSMQLSWSLIVMALYVSVKTFSEPLLKALWQGAKSLLQLPQQMLSKIYPKMQYCSTNKLNKQSTNFLGSSILNMKKSVFAPWFRSGLTDNSTQQRCKPIK